MSGAISVNGCVQISVDTFVDEMNGEKILTQNEIAVFILRMNLYPEMAPLKHLLLSVMSYKLKNVIIFLKITICFLLS